MLGFGVADGNLPVCKAFHAKQYQLVAHLLALGSDVREPNKHT